jgi:hypothetical protein
VAVGAADDPPARGIALGELAERTRCHSHALRPALLAAWLLDEGFAVEQDGVLLPTSRVSDLGIGLLVPIVDA